LEDISVTDHAVVHYFLLLYCRDENPKLPVPFNILSMFGDQDKSCVQDDPALHEGRIRSFAHERGNWASLIYIPCEYLNLINYLLWCICHVDFSERELTFTFARYVLLPIRLSSVCNACAPYSASWNFWQCFYAIWYLGHPL